MAKRVSVTTMERNGEIYEFCSEACRVAVEAVSRSRLPAVSPMHPGSPRDE